MTPAQFTKTTQTRCVGNSVNPDLAEAIVAANCRFLMPDEERIAA